MRLRSGANDRQVDGNHRQHARREVEREAAEQNEHQDHQRSATLEHPAWNNSTVLKGDVLTEVSTLKQHIDGDIVIAGSFQLVRTLIEHDLDDELRLKIFPVALGVGERLFGETSDKKPMRLLDTQTLEGGIAYLTYQSVRDA